MQEARSAEEKKNLLGMSSSIIKNRKEKSSARLWSALFEEGESPHIIVNKKRERHILMPC